MLGKLTNREQKRFDERLQIFKANKNNPLLRDHQLHGPYAGYRSINIGGDLRAIYKFLPPEKFIFIGIGTHDKLYS